MTQPHLFLTRIPKREDQTSKLILPSIWSEALYTELLSLFTVVYIIAINCKLSPDLKLIALHLWDLGWDEIDTIQGL